MQQAATDERMRQKAEELGERIRQKDGVATAVKLIKKHATYQDQRFTLDLARSK